MKDYPLEYYEFFVSFNEGDYYTCHDLLEEMWMIEKSNLFLKGLLQMSVAIYHYEYGNVKGARSMMKAAHEYLQSYRPIHWGLNLEKVYEFINESLLIIPQHLDRVPYEEVDGLPNLQKLYIFLDED